MIVLCRYAAMIFDQSSLDRFFNSVSELIEVTGSARLRLN
jgi:hypothetical protein